MIHLRLGSFCVVFSLIFSCVPTTQAPSQPTYEELEADRREQEKKAKAAAQAAQEKKRPKIEILKEGDVPVGVKITAPEGDVLQWVTISRGINSLKGRVGQQTVTLDPDSMKGMLFLAGIKDPPGLLLSISYSEGGWSERDCHEFDELYRYWIKEAERDNSSQAEIDSGQCSTTRQETMASALANAKSLFEASGNLEIKSAQSFVATPSGASVSLVISAQPSDLISLCVFGFSDVDFRVKQTNSKETVWEEQKPSDVALLLKGVSAGGSRCQITNARGNVETVVKGAGCASVLVVQQKP